MNTAKGCCLVFLLTTLTRPSRYIDLSNMVLSRAVSNLVNGSGRLPPQDVFSECQFPLVFQHAHKTTERLRIVVYQPSLRSTSTATAQTCTKTAFSLWQKPQMGTLLRPSFLWASDWASTVSHQRIGKRSRNPCRFLNRSA